MLDIPSSDSVLATLEAARTGSMAAAAAAAELGLTHGAVSRRIAAVEHWLGAPVFERFGRGVRLTPQGQIFVRRAERSLTSLAALRGELSTQRSRGTVRLSTLPSTARLWLMPRLARLEELTDQGMIEIISDIRLVRLDAREADVAIRYGTGVWPGVTSELLFADHIVPAAAPHIAKSLKGCKAVDLLRQSLIVDSDGADWRQWFGAAGVQYSEAGLRRRFVDYDLAIEAARQGLGIILLRLPLASRALADGSLTLLTLPGIDPDRGHHLVTLANEKNPRVLALIAALRTLAKDELR